MPRILQIGAMLLAWSNGLLAQEGPLIEEIIVTAQRYEESASKVPISISAFTDAMIDDRQIIGITDLQVAVPNLAYTQESFGGAKVVIRGIGDSTYDVLGRNLTSPGVPIHWNGISTPMRINITEFYDVERLEVLRGPQGTLYGRNSNAGSINIVQRLPNFDGFAGWLDAEYGDYDHKRAKVAVNLPVNDRLAFRAAGMWLNRDGYIENTAAKQLPDLDDDIDSRDLYSYRLTGLWQPSEDLKIWLMFSRSKEDDSRVPVHNVVCKTAVLPIQGCEADEFGLQAMHAGGVQDMIPAALAGAMPFGARDAASGLVYEFPRPNLRLRQQHTDVDPVFEADEWAYLLGAAWTIGPLTLELYGSYFENAGVTLQDEKQDVGFVLNPTVFNPTGLWPTSAPSGRVGSLRGGGRCDLESGRAGVAGGCTLNNDRRLFTYAYASSADDYWNTEFRLRSSFEGRFNFLVGANRLEIERDLEFYRGSNAFDIPGQYAALGGTQFYPSFFSLTDVHEAENTSIFGELYVDLSSRAKLTLGLRYDDDELLSIREIVQFQARNLTPGADGTLGPNPTWVRAALTSFFGPTPNDFAVFLADRYGATEAIESATTFDELVAALQIVPITARPGEGAAFRDAPNQVTFDEVTVRAVLDWQVTDDALVYASFNQGYRPGGIQNSFNQPSYDPETVDAYELGAKTRWADGTLSVNAAVFYNDYQGLQLFSRGEVAVINVGADTKGFELEVNWLPSAVPGLSVEFTYAWLEAEYDSSLQLDPLDRIQGDASLVALKNPNFGFNAFVAPIDEVLPLVDTAVALGAAIPVPGTVYDNGIPAYFSQGFLEFFGVSTSAGNQADISGNSVANAPPHSVTLGLAKTFVLGAGALTLRYDFYWQDDSYGREFNTVGDEIDDWAMHNASLIFESADGRWAARAWVRNIADKDIITGHYVQNQSSGAFRNYFLAEPRIFGASFRYNFGQVR